MEKTKQPVLNIGLAGHIDHGKTTLLYHLSGKWTDTHSEELKRGITIKLGYADTMIRQCKKCHVYTREEKHCDEETEEKRYVSFVDVPGHEMLMATMLSGAAIIDAALLVIAANEPCPKPQTREHLKALEIKDVKNIIVVQNKVDLVTKQQAEKNYEEIKNFLKGTVAENSLIVPCSAQQCINLDIIYEEICKLPVPMRDTASEQIFFVARSFDINKPGTEAKKLAGGVLGGILKQGIFYVNDNIEIKPAGIKTKIVALQSGNNALKEAFPSGSLAIQTGLDPFLTKADALAGAVICKEGSNTRQENKIKVKVTLLEKIIGMEKEEQIEKIKTREALLLSINTTIALGIVASIKQDEIEFSLKSPVVIIKGSKVGIARNFKGHWRLIGYGEVI